MIVDSALTETEAMILEAVWAGDLPDGVELPDAVLAVLHAEPDDDVEKAGGSADHLRRYWASGKGGSSIGWGSKGDFMRCVARVSKYMSEDEAKGYCNLRHKEATGKYPAEGHGARKAVVLDGSPAVVVMEKHAPGQHDQQSHGGGRGGGDTNEVMRGIALTPSPALAALIDRKTQMPTDDSEIDQQYDIGPALVEEIAAGGVGSHWTGSARGIAEIGAGARGGGQHDQSTHGRGGGMRATPGTEYTADGVPIAPKPTVGPRGEGYVPMAPDVADWPEDAQQHYLHTASTGDIGDLRRVAQRQGIASGMTAEEAGVYGRGVARRALTVHAQDTRPLPDSVDFAAYKAGVDTFRGGRVAVAVHPDAAQEILKGGRIKSQFETGKSNGMLAPSERAAAEVEMFGHHPSMNPAQRTVYGYMAPTGMETATGVRQYGPVRLVLKDDVRDRTTMTIGDSLSTMAVPMPVNGRVSLADRERARSLVGDYSGISLAQDGPTRWARNDYAEAQIHGGVKVTDIAEVWVPKPGKTRSARDTIAEQAESLGIPVRFYDPYANESAGLGKSAPLATRSDGATLHAAPGVAGFGEPMAQVMLDGVMFEPRPLRAILARGGWDETVVKAVVVPEFAKHLAGQHDQRTHGRHGGRIPTHAGMRVGETKDDAKAQANLSDVADRFDQLPPEMQAAMVASAASMGVTRESLEAEIEATLDRAVERTGDPPRGHDWYEQAHTECTALAADSGLSVDTSVGMVAAISPQMAWAPNLAVARYMAENRDAEVDVLALSKPITKRAAKPGGGGFTQETKSAYEWAALEVNGRRLDGTVRNVPPLADLAGKRMSDLDPYAAAALLKGHAQVGVGVFNGKRLTGQLSVPDDITGRMARVNFPGTSQTGRAMRIARGEPANDVINGHKVRSFHNNLLLPTDRHGDITVDSHAVSLAMGRKVSSSSPEYAAFTGGTKKGSPFMKGPSSATLGIKGNYALWADAYRSVAERRGLRANQLQSITWIQWRYEHPDNARTTHAMD